MKADTYTQCILQRGDTKTTSWIPTSFATLKRELRLKDADDKWEEGWVVIELGATESTEYVLSHERDFLHQRKASDI